jgi:hypothetical protein
MANYECGRESIRSQGSEKQNLNKVHADRISSPSLREERADLLGQHFGDRIVVPVQDRLGMRKGEERGFSVIGTHS